MKFLKHPITIIAIIILAVAALLIVGYKYWGWFSGSDSGTARTAIPEDVFTKSGTPVNPNQARKSCDSACLEAYGAGSQYYGYYYCKKNCASFRVQEPIYYVPKAIPNPQPHTPYSPPKPNNVAP